MFTLIGIIGVSILFLALFKRQVFYNIFCKKRYMYLEEICFIG